MGIVTPPFRAKTAPQNINPSLDVIVNYWSKGLILVGEQDSGRRFVRLIIDIERIDYIRTSINAVRNDLPDGAVEAEKKSESYGQQPALVS